MQINVLIISILSSEIMWNIWNLDHCLFTTLSSIRFISSFIRLLFVLLDNIKAIKNGCGEKYILAYFDKKNFVRDEFQKLDN